MPDPGFELELAQQLRERKTAAELGQLFRRFSQEDDYIDALMRRVCMRALARKCGHQLQIAPNVAVKHPETMEFGDGVVISEGTIIHGRFDGRCVIGDRVWIGPHSFLDARDLVIESSVGWGPGAKVLGSEHAGTPLDTPIVATDLVIAPVRVGAGADIGTNAVLLPGVTVGENAIVGAGAVVTADVPPFSKVAGVPAHVIGWRTDPFGNTGRISDVGGGDVEKMLHGNGEQK